MGVDDSPRSSVDGSPEPDAMNSRNALRQISLAILASSLSAKRASNPALSPRSLVASSCTDVSFVLGEELEEVAFVMGGAIATCTGTWSSKFVIGLLDAAAP